MNSGATPSIRKRLLARIAGVLFITWIVAAIFTKYLAWDASSQFLREQTKQLSEGWIEIALNANFIEAPATIRQNQLVLSWRDNNLILNHSPIALPMPSRDTTKRILIGEHKWMLSSLCRKNVCVIFGIRDKERKYAIRHYMLAIFLPLLVIFCCSMIAMFYAVKSGLTPLYNLASYLSSKPVNELYSIDKRGADAELVPLIESINQLIENLLKQLTKERQFLDTCAHELRTPVTALLAQLQLLQGNRRSECPSIDSRQAERISLSAHRTSRAASQILSLARNANALASESQLKMNEVNVDICELTRQVISDILTAYPQLECKMSGRQSIVVHADSLAIEMMIGNLVENAGRYSKLQNDNPAECQVSIELLCNSNSAEDNGATICFVVEDNGLGVREEDLQSIFDRFYRSSNLSDVESPDGVGLGLSIVKDVAERYGGSATAEKSQQLGGLKVSVILSGIIVNEG